MRLPLGTFSIWERRFEEPRSPPSCRSLVRVAVKRSLHPDTNSKEDGFSGLRCCPLPEVPSAGACRRFFKKASPPPTLEGGL